jgi:hypothetical protein
MKLVPLATLAAFAASTGGCGGGGSDAPILDAAPADAYNPERPDATNDFDLDGILDADDNCPTVINVNQGNEDGDKFGDACDPCPVVADDNPPNADGDEVADACDPLPTTPGDHIKYFEGFHTDVPAGWEEAGTWTHNAGAIVTSSTSASLGVVATDRSRETVSAALTFDAVGTADPASTAGVVDNKMVAGASGVACVLSSTQGVAVYSLADAANATTQPYTLTPGTKYIVKLKRDANAYACSVTEGTATGTTTRNLVISNTPWVSGVVASHATVRFHWFMVVESL